MVVNKKNNDSEVGISLEEKNSKRTKKVQKKEILISEDSRKKIIDYDDYLNSVKEICDLALMNGDLRSAISAKKLEADWFKQNKNKDKNKIGINSMSEEELENLISELEDSLS